MIFCEFVKGLQGAGLGAAVGAVLSFVVEWWKGYGDLSAVYKRVVFLGLCLVIPLVAASVGVLSCGQSATFVDTWWPALVAGFAAFGAGTVAHTRDL